MDVVLVTLIGGTLGAIWATLYGFKPALERHARLIWGTYRWAGGPRFHLVIGSAETPRRVDTIFEIGTLGKVFYVAPWPR